MRWVANLDPVEFVVVFSRVRLIKGCIVDDTFLVNVDCVIGEGTGFVDRNVEIGELCDVCCSIRDSWLSLCIGNDWLGTVRRQKDRIRSGGYSFGLLLRLRLRSGVFLFGTVVEDNNSSLTGTPLWLRVAVVNNCWRACPSRSSEAVRILG